MLKYVFALVAVYVSIHPLLAQDTTTVLKNAQRIEAPEEEITAAKNETEKLFADISRSSHLFESFVIIGANLWNRMKDQEPFSEMEAANVIFKIPKFDASGKWTDKEDVIGKVFQEKDEFLSLLLFLRDNLGLKNAKLSDLNNRDKFIFWLYFAKMEEPLLAIQTDKTRMILKYVKGKLFFIDISSSQ